MVRKGKCNNFKRLCMKYVLLLLTLSTTLWAQIPPHNRPGYCPLQRSYKCFDFVAERVSKWEVDDEYEVVSLENAFHLF